ncbi:MAG TPA: hypothetical protein VIL20_26930 [Sandaracinaceae bacterium]
MRDAIRYGLLVSVLTAAACGAESEGELDAHRVLVAHGAHRLEVTQRFDPRGELVETRVVHHRGRLAREVAVRGALLTGEGATDGGALLRAFLAGVPPELLARLHRADVRFDIAVLTVDALLELDARGQRAAVRALEGEGSLCTLLGACASVPGHT